MAYKYSKILFTINKYIFLWSGIFIINTAIIAILIQIMLSYVSISMNYYPDFFPEAYNFMKKRSSFPDVIFMFSKILIIIIFIFDKQKDSEHWGILFVLCFITG